MNYYEHHIGDYDADTAHLTWVEDMAYTRLIRLCYRREKPIPADLAQACRLVRAQTKEQKDAVQSVLQEFFVLKDDGWHQDRCDAEIARYQAGEPEREAKRVNEEVRMKRHRDERAALFKKLADAGQHAPWNIGIKELRAMAENVAAETPETRIKQPPETQPATAPATPATATQTPDTTTQTPITYSVPNGTDDESSDEKTERQVVVTDRERIFAVGVPMLTAAGVSEKNARSMLAMLAKLHTEEVVADAVAECAADGAIEPVSWLQNKLKSGPRKRVVRSKRHSGFEELDYTEGINADGSFA